MKVLMRQTPKTVEWGTPQDLFDQLDDEFGPFTLDPCATAKNAKCGAYYSAAENGLARDWSWAKVWVNPPYGRETAKWVAKAATCGARIVVALLPARTDTRWFHEHVLPKADVIRFLPGRVYFENPSHERDRAPFPSMVVVWRKK